MDSGKFMPNLHPAHLLKLHNHKQVQLPNVWPLFYTNERKVCVQCRVLAIDDSDIDVEFGNVGRSR